jgi:hypothetical protein
MSKRIYKSEELTGKTFNRWTVLGKSDKKTNANKILWKCQCECKTIREIVGTDLKYGKSRSCGCLKKECNVHKDK